MIKNTSFMDWLEKHYTAVFEISNKGWNFCPKK